MFLSGKKKDPLHPGRPKKQRADRLAQLSKEMDDRLSEIERKQDRLADDVILHFDQLRNEYNARLDEIDRRQNELGPEVVARFDQLRNEYNARLDQIDYMQNEQLKIMDVKGIHNEMMFWQLYRKPEETTEEAKRRFFMGLPQTEGNLRLFQLGNAFLLKKLMGICKEHDLTIWLAGGTLLGAYRHQGFIPWDDDIDTNMFRDDIEKLQDMIRDNPQYKITTVYDYIAKCRQIRFRFRDDRIPCFVDIFYVDYCADASAEAWTKQYEIRNGLVASVNKSIKLDEWKRRRFLTPADALAKRIEDMFCEYQRKMIENRVVVDKQEAKATIFGIDNLTAIFHDSSSLKDMFPLATLKFEGTEYPVPKNYPTYLRKHYGDIYRLPDDMVWHTHAEHPEMENIKDLLLPLLQGEGTNGMKSLDMTGLHRPAKNGPR